MRAQMLSAVISLTDPAAPDAIDRLADTLSALVSGVAAGLVGDAVIVTAAASEAVATVAEATGAALVPHDAIEPADDAVEMGVNEQLQSKVTAATSSLMSCRSSGKSWS